CFRLIATSLFFFFMMRRSPSSTLFPYTTLFRSNLSKVFWPEEGFTKRDMLNYYYQVVPFMLPYMKDRPQTLNRFPNGIHGKSFRSEEHTSELQSRENLVCRLLLEKQKRKKNYQI